MTTSNDHLPIADIEDLDGFTLRTIDRIFGVDLSPKGCDLRSLFRRELELELQPKGVTMTRNDEGAGKRVEIVFSNPFDGSLAVKVN